MKISCQSCQAKYTIADEKVLGKIVKIRCKKCGATIVINGNEAEAPQGEAQQPAAAVYDYSSQTGGESWTVNVADGDQRTMTTAEVVASFSGGVINEETFCWKDGMADWLPVRDVPEIMGALGAPSFHAVSPHDDSHVPAAPAAAAPAPAPAAQPQPGFSSLFGGGGGGGSNGGSPLFGGSGDAAAAAAPAAAARRAGGRGGGGADLFGAAAAAGGEEDVMTSASASPQMAPGSDKRTGERNENSVLFSLNALTDAAPKQETPMAQGDGSGLIDIRALSNSMKDSGPTQSKVDDIMNLSGGGAFSAALAAPVLAPPSADMQEMAGGQQQKKSSAGLIIGLIGGFAVLGIIVVGALLVLRRPEPIAPAPATTTATTPPTTPATTDTSVAAGGSNTPPTGSVAVGTTATAARPGVGVSTGTTGRPTGTAVTVSTGATTTTTTTTAVTAPGAGRCHCAASDFNCKMAEGAGAACPGAGPPPTAENTGGGAAFDRSAAGTALGGIAGNLSSCKKADGPTGSGHVKVTFNPSGTVSTVDVDTPPFSGTAVGGCVAGKFRSAKVPAFGGAPMTVGKTFTIN